MTKGENGQTSSPLKRMFEVGISPLPFSAGIDIPDIPMPQNLYEGKLGGILLQKKIKSSKF